MENWLSKPYCEFDPEEWENETDIPVRIDSSTSENSISCYYNQKSSPCELHRDVSMVTIEEISNTILKHFQQSPSDPTTQRIYNTVVGIEISGLDLNGRTFRASHSNEIDIRYLIAHGEVNFSGSEIVNNLGLHSSLFTAGFEALGVTFSKNAIFDNSRFEQGADFRRALFGEGASFYGTTVEGDLDLSQTTIHSRLNLQDITVNGDLILRGATIKGDVELENAVVSGELDLRHATVEGSVRAHETNTETVNLFSTHIVGSWISSKHEIGTLDWINSRFESSVILNNCTIQDSFSSIEVTIEEGLRWYKTSAKGPVEFSDSQFKHVSAFLKGEIQGSFNVRHSNMGHHLWINDVDIEDDVVLAGTELGSYTLLQDTEIKGDLLASSANASGVIRFMDVDIEGETELTDLAVEEHLEFLSCTFESTVDLGKSVVNEYIQFQDGTFQSDLVARNSRIGRNFEVAGCDFSDKIDLTGAQIGTLFLNDGTATESLILEKAHVTDRAAVLNGITVRQTLSLNGASLHRGVQLSSACVGELRMKDTEITGPFVGKELTAGTSTGDGSFLAADARVSGEFQLEDATINGRLDLENTDIKRRMNTDKLHVAETFSLSNAHLGGDIRGNGMNVGNLNLTGATSESVILFNMATIRGNVDGSKLTSTGSNITFFQSQIHGEVSFSNADLGGDLIVTGCQLKGKKNHNSISDKADLPENIPDLALNAASAVIGGVFHIENSYIRDTVYTRGAKLQTITLDKATVTGEYFIDETEIEETLTITGSTVFGIVKGTDLRISSKCKIKDLTAKAIDFDDSLFKWNVTISESLVGEATFRNATFRNAFRLQRIMAYKGCIYLNHARISDMSIRWARGSTTVRCEQARLGNLETRVPKDSQLWDRLRINRTQFDEFDFADFTASLSRTDHLIHQDDQWDRSARYRAFLPTVLQHGRQLLSGDIVDLPKKYEDHEVTYRRAKDSADTTGDNPAASKFYMHEKKYQRRRQFWAIFTGEGSSIRNWIAWITNLGLGILAGHGERASQVGLSAITLVTIFGALLFIIPSLTAEGTLFQPLTALEQSLRTFVGAPSAIDRTSTPYFVEWLLLVERALGIAFIPLLVFALTRSLHR
ncbi:pentapeptide repeat-containing protein [Halorubrum saccharovorum]|uniref:pentapeptide repeat-containing protein n=1 Tax=Halorubrum saccharovorum TaxID=2248 RepID=UPI0009B5C60F|nr:pentapeptide repeat-containing protein [Halorubrum saccharovorum]